MDVSSFEPLSSPYWSLEQPSEEFVTNFLRRHVNGYYSYIGVGGTNEPKMPWPYIHDHNRVKIGEGLKVYLAAMDAMRAWKMFPAPWTRVISPRPELSENLVVAMQAHALGVWWLNACRIIYFVNELEPRRRWGFAYGTLEAHVEKGEERFSIEMHEDGSVWYDLRAFSRPAFWPVQLGFPIARLLQKRFVRQSQAAMVAVGRAAMAAG